MKIQDKDLLLDPSCEDPPATFKSYIFKGLKLGLCIIAIIIIYILLSKVNITLIINLKENQSHTAPLSTVQTAPIRCQPTSSVTINSFLTYKRRRT
jgi:hypothetical protein